MRSKYIVIEGLEGAGKTTARDVVVETLNALGVTDMVFTREPGGTNRVFCFSTHRPPAEPLARRVGKEQVMPSILYLQVQVQQPGVAATAAGCVRWKGRPMCACPTQVASDVFPALERE